MLFHEGRQFHTGTLAAEAVFSFFGARASISYGPGYFMYSPVGLIMFAPAVFMRTLSETGGARGDPMHLWAANGYANGVHSNDFYGYVDTSKAYTDCSDKHAILKGNFLPPYFLLVKILR